jgi:hypothetical protein
MTADQTKQSLLGEWISIAPELRPGSSKYPDGSTKPFYLTRSFKYLTGDHFELSILNLADPYGKIPMAKIDLQGHMVWQGDHAIAEGAQKVDFIADEAYEVTPLLQAFADAMNQLAGKEFNKWEVKGRQSILGKAFAPFGLTDGQIFMEFDLVYIFSDMLFWGARHVDGRGFDKEENRPTNLQIPLIRKK